MANIGKEDIFFYGGMDSDSMLETIAEGNYLKAINCYNADGGVGNKRGKVRKVKSNRKIDNNYITYIRDEESTPVIHGKVVDEKNNKIYIYHASNTETNESNENFLITSIYEYDTNKKEITNLVAQLEYNINDEIIDRQELFYIIGGQKTTFISGKVLGGNLYWTDGITEPRCINIEKSINYFKFIYQGIDNPNRYYVFNEALTYAIAQPPTVPIVATYEHDDTVLVNYLRGKLFQFRYKYVYNDNKESVWSAMSEVPYPYGELLIDGSYTDSTNYNAIDLQFNIDQPELRKVVIAVRYTTELEVTGKTVWSDFRIIDNIKINNSTNDIDTETTNLTYRFYNNTYGTIVSDEESYKLYDSMPLAANCMETISSPDKVVYGGCTENFDNIENADVTLDIVCNDIETITGNTSPITQKQYMLPYGREAEVPVMIINYLTGLPITTNYSYIPYKYYGTGIIHKIVIPADINLTFFNVKFSCSGVNSGSWTSGNIDVSGATSTEDLRDIIINYINSNFGSNRAFASWDDLENYGGVSFWTDNENNSNQAKWYIANETYKNYFRDNILNVSSDQYVIYVKSGQIIRDVNTYEVYPDSKIRLYIPANTPLGSSTYYEDVKDLINKTGLNTLGNKYISNTLNKDGSLYIGDYGGFINSSFIDYKLSNEEWTEYQNKRSETNTTVVVGQPISTTITGSNIQETLNPFGRYCVGMVYYDDALRCSAVQKALPIGSENNGHKIDINGNTTDTIVQNGNEISIPRTDSEYGDALYYNCRMTIRHDAPSWAKYWSPVFTKNKNHENFFEINLTDYFVGEYTDPLGTIDSTKRTFDINSSIQRWNDTFPNANLVAYIFQKGDRIIFYGKEDGDTVNKYIDREILDQQADGKLVIETSIQLDSSPTFANPRIVRIYTPSVSPLEDNYFEVGKMYPVINGVHYSDTEAQGTGGLTLDIPFGDIFLNVIDYYKAKKGANPVYAVYNDYFCPFYPSAINDMGRVHRINENIKQTKYGGRIRYSNAYIQNSQIDGASAFEPNNYIDLPDKFGEIRYLAEMGYTLKALMDNKNISIYIGRQSIVNPEGTEQMILSTSSLGTVSIPVSSYGCQHPESVVVNERYMYFFDVNNGCFVRDAANGMHEISKNLQESFFRDIAKKVKENTAINKTTKVYGGYDANDNIVLLSFVDVRNIFTQTIAFNENKNLFTHFVDYKRFNFSIQGFAYLNNALLTFYQGDVYLEGEGVGYCNFFGQQKDAYIEFVGNANPKKLKAYSSLSVHATTKWHCGTDGDISILPSTTYPNGMSSRLKEGKFKDKEGIFYSEFLRDGSSRPVYTDGLINGRKLRGNVIKIILRNDGNDETELFSSSIKFVNSELSF